MSNENQTQADCPMSAQPQAEHQWLEQLLGDWEFEGECLMGPDQPPMKSAGTETVRSLGGLWIVGEGRAAMADGTGDMQSITTLGYDPQRGRFVGTFVATMMNFLWVYDGELDADRRVLTLSVEGPNMAPDAPAGAMCQYRDVHTIVDKNTRTLTAFLQTEDGQWIQIMSATYTRKG